MTRRRWLENETKEAASKITRIEWSLFSASVFCLLSLLTPDSALLIGNATVNVPLAGPVSFFGFLLLGPAVLIVLRIYLQIYIERISQLNEWATLSGWSQAKVENSLLRAFSWFILYLLLPLTMLAFTWKAAAFPPWGAGLATVTVIVSMGFAPRLSPHSWEQHIAGAVAAGVVVGSFIGSPPILEYLRRSFYLSHATLADLPIAGLNLSHAVLISANLKLADLTGVTLDNADLTGANLTSTNLAGAFLRGATLTQTSLIDADLSSTDLTGAKLFCADMAGANLSRAILTDADLAGVNFNNANLKGAKLAGSDLSKAMLLNATFDDAMQLESACGIDALLPNAIKLKPCAKSPSRPVLKGRGSALCNSSIDFVGADGKSYRRNGGRVAARVDVRGFVAAAHHLFEVPADQPVVLDQVADFPADRRGISEWLYDVQRWPRRQTAARLRPCGSMVHVASVRCLPPLRPLGRLLFPEVGSITASSGAAFCTFRSKAVIETNHCQLLMWVNRIL